MINKHLLHWLYYVDRRAIPTYMCHIVAKCDYMKYSFSDFERNLYPAHLCYSICLRDHSTRVVTSFAPKITNNNRDRN